MFVSIIIPMRNEEAFVAQCLDSVLAQVEAHSDVEILCVDGASTDRTEEFVMAYARGDARIRLLRNSQRIAPAAMNLAIREARGDVIIRLDCHAIYAPDYINKCLEALNRTGADNVGGYMRTLPGSDSAVGRAIAAATSSRFGVGGSLFRTGGEEQEADTVPFGCFRRDVFDRFGMYDERLVRNQDIELNSRIRKGGGKIVISPEIKLTYYNRSTYGGLRQQAFYNGLWNAYTLFLVRGGLRLRHFVPLGFVLSILALAVAGAFFWPIWIALAAEVLLYLAAGAYMARKAARGGGECMWLILLAFICLHVPYGFGSLLGILHGPSRFVFRELPSTGVPARRRD